MVETHAGRSPGVTSGPSGEVDGCGASVPPRETVRGRRPAPHIHDPPEEFDPFVARFGTANNPWVWLEEFPFEEIRGAMGRTRERTPRHFRFTDPSVSDTRTTHRGRALIAIRRSDHRWLVSSLEERANVVPVVEGEDHGASLPALGEYDPLLAAALTRHRRDGSQLARHRSATGFRPLQNPN